MQNFLKMQNCNNPFQLFMVKIIYHGGLWVYFNIFDIMWTRIFQIRPERFYFIYFIIIIFWGEEDLKDF